MASNAQMVRDEPESISEMAERLGRIAQDLDVREAELNAHIRELNAQEALCGNPDKYEVVDQEVELATQGDRGSEALFYT